MFCLCNHCFFWDAGLVCEQPLFTTDWDWLFVRPGYCVVNLPLLIITLLRFLIKNHLVLSVNLRWTCVNGYIHNCIKQLLKNYYSHEQGLSIYYSQNRTEIDLRRITWYHSSISPSQIFLVGIPTEGQARHNIIQEAQYFVTICNFCLVCG